MHYGALRGLSHENVKNERRNQNSTNRIWPLSTIILALMTAALLFVMWDGKKKEIASDGQSSSFEIRLKELKQNANTSNLPATAGMKFSSLVPDSGGGDDPRSADILSLSTLLKGSMSVQCSDTVSWGR
jgi:hypothetical protein